ncbi:hypothetical protein CLCR_07191 [Cladophialophora carrionii]|uniref:ATP-grasp domain-containing protein n=1 Tax=Cladophialophora carrionii TaxID=86049 RepID=A0A1C1CMZ2_9EURO|nr:hypothetical protein CLCR_07191 [Cladophialophora carrionii]
MAPLIELDATVADLYRTHGITGPFITSTHCSFAHLDLHPFWTRETIFPEDEEPIPYSADEQERNRVRKIILGLKPIRRALVLGDMDVLFLSPCAAKENVDRIFNQLIPEQRPRARYVDLDQGDVDQQLHRLSQGRTLIYWRPQGWMLEHKCLVPPRVAYELNSKLYLVNSGIRTPASEPIQLAPNVADSVLGTRELPFVVKLFLAGCGFGTHLVTSEARRQIMLAAMAEYQSRGGTHVLLSEYIRAKQCDLSAHFVIGAPSDTHNKDNPLIMGVAMQSLTNDGHWTGSSIDYGAQDELRGLLRDTIRDTTRRLPKSFVGWCGVDVLIDEQDGQWVVDLNARFTGSMALCLLSSHFYKRLGFRFAEAGSFQYRGECGDVSEILSRDIETGKVVMNAVASIDDGVNMVDLIWGGHSRQDLASTADLLRAELSRERWSVEEA